nr:hypothetical protein [Pygmaiobacter massiliensis]
MFADELDKHLAIHSLYKYFKRAVTRIGVPAARFHDLRHTYAVAAIQEAMTLKPCRGIWDMPRPALRLTYTVM